MKKPRRGVYTYSLFKGNHSRESKIIEYGSDRTDRTFGQIEHLHFPNIFLYFSHSYDMTSLGNIHHITFWKYTKQAVKVSLKISNVNMEPFYKGFERPL